MTPHLQAHYEMYTSAISQDPIASILRFHLLTEYYLEQIIRVTLPRGDKLVDSTTLSYAQKLLVVEAVESLHDKLISSLKNLNKLRNKCSHQLNQRITHGDLEPIGSPLGKDWTSIKKKDVDENERIIKLFSLISANLARSLVDLEDIHHQDEDHEIFNKQINRKSSRDLTIEVND